MKNYFLAENIKKLASAMLNFCKPINIIYCNYFENLTAFFLSINFNSSMAKFKIKFKI